MPDRPRITIIIPIRNEAAFITACLESLLADPLAADAELLVYDGQSTDQSATLVRQLSARHPQVILVDNPRRIQAAAFNHALDRARGDYLLRADAHSIYPADYITESIRLLESTGAGNVGGIQQATGRGWISGAIAAALSSRFGVGDAKYRYATAPEFTDTVYLGCWRTDTLRAIGGMREDWAVNEDYEMNVRLRAAGHRVYLSPTIRSTYFVRASLASLLRQYARYGFWKVRTLMEHAHSVRARQIVPPLFVLSIIAAWPLTHRFGIAGALHLFVYAAANLAISVATAARSRWTYLPLLPLVFLIIHVAWGCGFLAGLVWWPWRLRRTAAANVRSA
jgi:glycosyltransferase involved in cell wall biosynthesis